MWNLSAMSLYRHGEPNVWLVLPHKARPRRFVATIAWDDDEHPWAAPALLLRVLREHGGAPLRTAVLT